MSGVFSRTDPDIVTDAFEVGEIVSFKRGDIILDPADSHKAIYLIKSGFVKVYSINNRDEQYVHVVYDSGEIFSLFWLVNDVARNVYYEALTDCTVSALPRDEVRARAKTDAAFCYRLLKRVTEQFRVYDDRVDNLEYKYASERLAYCLLFMASRFGVKQGDQVLLQAPITHQVLGSTINLSRESVTRELDKLAKKDLIDYQDRLIVIKNVDQLKSQFKRPISPNWWGLEKTLLLSVSTSLAHMVAFGLIIIHYTLK